MNNDAKRLQRIVKNMPDFGAIIFSPTSTWLPTDKEIRRHVYTLYKFFHQTAQYIKKKRGRLEDTVLHVTKHADSFEFEIWVHLLRFPQQDLNDPNIQYIWRAVRRKGIYKIKHNLNTKFTIELFPKSNTAKIKELRKKNAMRSQPEYQAPKEKTSEIIKTVQQIIEQGKYYSLPVNQSPIKRRKKYLTSIIHSTINLGNIEFQPESYDVENDLPPPAELKRHANAIQLFVDEISKYISEKIGSLELTELHINRSGPVFVYDIVTPGHLFDENEIHNIFIKKAWQLLKDRAYFSVEVSEEETSFRLGLLTIEHDHYRLLIQRENERQGNVHFISPTTNLLCVYASNNWQRDKAEVLKTINADILYCISNKQTDEFEMSKLRALEKSEKIQISTEHEEHYRKNRLRYKRPARKTIAY